jgi:hypothetical protein
MIEQLRNLMPFSDSFIIGEYLSVGDFIFAVIAAFVAVWCIRRLAALVNFLSMSPEEYRQYQFNRIIDRCYALFPRAALIFGGRIFIRGMSIRVTSVTNRTIEGRFMGVNKHGVICLMLESEISAEILDNVLEIMIIEE